MKTLFSSTWSIDFCSSGFNLKSWKTPLLGFLSCLLGTKILSFFTYFCGGFFALMFFPCLRDL